ncbi:rho GTPase-activating protein 7-like isoform X3 [Phoenix dactylifera]|uniref:Rho GTPase-activating protein 7-like isoform X3 n=1 Tax=Phoenix dactylifera TaxID=42345 RepID=A0A8B9AGI6_PHODC|nr:rho GTPase-activating protein 7-like isoform X3 [Phoenix dactylifera]
MMASSNLTENAMQCKTCHGEGDPNIRTTWISDNPDKQSNTCPNCQIFKSGPLFISSKGIGWTSWKKRWFVLTRTSLVFFRSDPNSLPQKGNEANLTLGGMDLNNSGSVVVKADKKLLIVLFPDGRDGRTFTLKAETSEDLYEWKSALENALALAPGACAMGQNGIFCNDITDSNEASGEQVKDKEPEPVKSTVIGRPILLALEDIDGSPSFLEKALRFIEDYGIKVEGILRQSADVEEVKRRVKDYEQGKNEFSSDEDAHVIGDCIKYVLRELPSSPVPASCCTALVDAYRTDRGDRMDAMRAAIYETFPEPNRRLVQRILKMMRTVAYHRSENRMSLSALAACMAPLLLRPLLAGDCEFEDDFTMGGDGSIQLLQAAAAANHAQAIVIILLEEYGNIFDEDLLEDGSFSSELYSESEGGDVEDDESTDHDIPEDDGYHDGHNGLETDIDDDPERSSSGTLSERSSYDESDPYDDKATEDEDIDGTSPRDDEPSNTKRTLLLRHDHDQKSSSTSNIPYPEDVGVQKYEILPNENINSSAAPSCEPNESIGNVPPSTEAMLKSVSHNVTSSVTDKSNEPAPSIKQRTVWGRTSARKNLSMESIDYSSDDEIAIQRLEGTKSDLQTKIAKEVKGNTMLQASLERRKEALRERRLALEQDVEKLREQLQKERDLRASLESGLMNMRPGNISYASAMDSKFIFVIKTRADLEEVAFAEADIINLKQKVADLRGQLNNQPQKANASLCESCSKLLYTTDKAEGKDQTANIESTTLAHQNKMLSKSDDVSSGRACEKMLTPTQDLLSSPNANPSYIRKPERASQDNTIFSGTGSCSSEERPTLGTLAPSKKFASKDENSNSLANRKDVKVQTPDSPSLPSTQPLLNQQVNMTTQSSKMSPGPNRISCTEDPTTIVCNTLPKSTSRGESSMLAADSENVKTLRRDTVSTSDRQPSQKQPTNTSSMSSMLAADTKNVRSVRRDLVSTSDRRPSQKQQRNTSNMNSSISSGLANIPSTEGSTTDGFRTASKKSLPKVDNVKTETQVLPSLPNRQPSQMQQPNNANPNSSSSLKADNVSSEESAAVGRTASSKKSSSKPEETTSSSSALVKLTNRLNFLKERRAQLVNELQDMDINRSSGPEGPPLRTNSR